MLFFQQLSTFNPMSYEYTLHTQQRETISNHQKSDTGAAVVSRSSLSAQQKHK
jgi:hypothetical protein